MPNILKSILHNIGVAIVSLVLGYLGTKLDLLLGIAGFQSTLTIAIGLVLILIGFLIRAWATYLFYEHSMAVIVLHAQQDLLTTGPYTFSRNPLYLGGNVFMFLGAALLFGSPSALVFTILHLPLVDLFIRREERQLELHFGDRWRDYRSRVRRWI